MRVNQRGSTTKPISITEHFLDRLGALIQVIRDMNTRSIAAKYQVDTPAINTIAAIPLDELQDPPWPAEADEDEFKKFKEIYDKLQFQKRVSHEIRNLNAASFDVSYDNGFRTSTSDLDQFKEVLRNELGRVESMTVSIGELYDRTGARVRFNYVSTTASFDIAGERVDVDAVFKTLTELLDSAAPDHPILHNGWFHAVAAYATSITACAALFDLFGFNFQDKNGTNQLALEVYTTMLAAVPFAALIVFFSRKSFPAFKVEFGDDFRRQKARQARFAFVVAVVLIPIVINILV